MSGGHVEEPTDPGARCPACGSRGTAAGLDLSLGEAGEVALSCCRSCRTQYWETLTPGVDQASEYWEGYKFDLYDDAAVRRSYHERYERMLGLLARVGERPHTLLDIGGGIGNFAEWALHRGINAVMSDVDGDAVEEARRRGVPACTPGGLGDMVPSNGVDVVTLWDVVEHTAEPSELLRQALAWATPGGALFIETPDARFPLRTVLLALRKATRGRIDRTGGLYYWEHKVYFSERGIRILLERLGLEVLAVERWPSPGAKIVKLFGRGGPQGISALHRAIARTYPLLQAALTRLRLGNKLIVVARTQKPAALEG